MDLGMAVKGEKNPLSIMNGKLFHFVTSDEWFLSASVRGSTTAYPFLLYL